MPTYSIAQRNVNCGWCPTIATHLAELTKAVRPKGRRRTLGPPTAWPACDTHAATLRRDPTWRVPYVPATESA